MSCSSDSVCISFVVLVLSGKVDDICYVTKRKQSCRFRFPPFLFQALDFFRTYFFERPPFVVSHPTSLEVGGERERCYVV